MLQWRVKMPHIVYVIMIPKWGGSEFPGRTHDVFVVEFFRCVKLYERHFIRTMREVVKSKITRPVSMLGILMPPFPELGGCIAPQMPLVSAHLGGCPRISTSGS